MKDKPQLAFPVYPRTQGAETRELKDMIGMSLRDYFAAKAMQGILANSNSPNPTKEYYKKISGTAYLLADAMLAERKK